MRGELETLENLRAEHAHKESDRKEAETKRMETLYAGCWSE